MRTVWPGWTTEASVAPSKLFVGTKRPLLSITKGNGTGFVEIVTTAGSPRLTFPEIRLLEEAGLKSVVTAVNCWVVEFPGVVTTASTKSSGVVKMGSKYV